MEESELKFLWKSVSDFEIVTFEKELLNQEVRQHVHSFNRKILVRDLVEIGMALMIIPIGLFIAYLIPDFFIRTGAILLVPSALLIIYKILKTRKIKNPVQRFTSNQQYLENNLVYYQNQKQLLGSVLYWYILPPGICALLILTGLDLPALKFYYSLAIALGVGYVVYWLNKMTITKKIDPLIKRLEEELGEFKRM
jgi:hypothetical protein